MDPINSRKNFYSCEISFFYHVSNEIIISYTAKKNTDQTVRFVYFDNINIFKINGNWAIYKNSPANSHWYFLKTYEKNLDVNLFKSCFKLNQDLISTSFHKNKYYNKYKISRLPEYIENNKKRKMPDETHDMHIVKVSKQNTVILTANIESEILK